MTGYFPHQVAGQQPSGPRPLSFPKTGHAGVGDHEDQLATAPSIDSSAGINRMIIHQTLSRWNPLRGASHVSGQGTVLDASGHHSPLRQGRGEAFAAGTEYTSEG